VVIIDITKTIIYVYTLVVLLVQGGTSRTRRD